VSKHQLPAGKRAIEFLGRLGSAIGYEVRFEYPISGDLGSKERCDVAWMTDNEQEFPLFLFEVESTTTNSMTYNALKVFSKPSHDFLKPLFLFHVVISGTEDSSVAESLGREFGKFNYRLFHLESSGWVPILCSVLEQHRRVSLSIDLARLIDSLLWFGLAIAAIEQVIAFSEKLLFRRSDHFVPRVLAGYSLRSKEFLGAYTVCLEHRLTDRPARASSDYGTYWGNEWCHPIHLGILAATNSSKAPVLLDRVKVWQLNEGSSSMIGPHFGLSRDYDLFLAFARK
jgi:hypothetical protein